ncbi:MAG: disulfide bond formation protein DsbA [Candidatus Zambryskibacteria bacterium CG11_big_fil_rev_8_21_14_0_20_42_18]|uniref:Disulfide bond formation protein DsbA n=1 Tax=Candidatus Zambryskibacteria bacterium CG_4_9_14_3_um_filter_42_15 TaxID=1975112 RepID=A0A2M7WSI6_9BACT|nr:MAG: disulfide bond formation protein DsbA [Candidatus Zambryskibacteria bacterium CG11_big_fil_rev_8_21_14_0_20_42_18]PJA32944.1 MAG: disulfide bond formation protein DsbA [Candidatus Zambryskibacteria bacterium CG_4_9_14_3_um_filter_42_15]
MEPNQEQSPLNKQLVPLSIVVAGGLIALAVYFGGGGTGKLPTNNAVNTETAGIEIAPVTAKDHILGSRNAELVIVEYSDTECPFCKNFHSTMHQVITDYDGKVAWVYRHFPIAQLHSKAPNEAEATECAAELGGNQIFWRYIDKLFETTNSNDSLDPAELPKIATTVGLNEEAFKTCLSSGKYTEFITKSVEDSIKAGARGTPYSVIITKDDQKVIINGAEPIASVKAKIDALLK